MSKSPEPSSLVRLRRLFRRACADYSLLSDGDRVLVALSGGTVAGFTGPVYPEPTGRGYFAGIAVAEQYRGHGLGKLLFYRLCRAEKERGARYMSLFTGIDNPAQNIYKEAGFTPRRYFAVMIKELKP